MQLENHETEVRQSQEARLFVKYCVILVALLAAFLFVSNAYAADELVAETPFNVGGSDDSTVFVIDTTDPGDLAVEQRATPNIIYAYDTARRVAFVSNYVPSSSDSNTSDEGSTAIRTINPFAEEVDKSLLESSENGGEGEIEVYVPDSDDDCPVSDAVPLPVELQEYLWTKAKKATGDYKNYYAFLLGVMEHESSFRAGATHYNSNGSTDRGIMQINSSNIGKMKRAGLIGSAQDLYDAYKCIDCGTHMLNNYISMFGVSESAYYAYNTGRERQGSNKNSRIVMKYMAKWNSILFS